MTIKATHKHNIVNPAKWIGKYVRHMANWRDFQWPETTNDNATDDYFVCEWTGHLTQICNQAFYDEYFTSKQEAEAAGYDECYYYSPEGLYQMWVKANSVGLAV